MGSCIPCSWYIGFIGGAILPVSPRGRFTTANAEAYAVQSWPTDPIGNTTVTFSGVQAGTEIRVYLPDGTEAAGVEECTVDPVLTWPVYAAGSPNNTVFITLLKRGYRWQRFNYHSIVGSQTLPIFQIADLGYSNPS